MASIHSILEKNDIEASAPCRIDMGGTLDLSTFYLPLHHLGPCTFNAALNMRTQVRLSAFREGNIRISAAGFDDFVSPTSSASFHHSLGLMAAVAAYFNADGVHIHIDSASPPRSALGGSSVAAVALIWAFAKARALYGHAMPDRIETALLAHAIEQSVAGVPCGLQDQLAAVFGGVNAWYWENLPGKKNFRHEVLFNQGAAHDFSRQILVAYCGEPHVSKDINGNWVREFVAGKNRNLWRQIIHYSRTFIEGLAEGRIDLAQTAMNQETDLRCQMTPEVLDAVGQHLIAVARDQGCGARFTGAGGGGCVWALGTLKQIEDLRATWQSVVDQHKTAKILETGIDMDGVL
jgi:D-glycero-alpha-D-manno-heptose-7-phosphate kinase